MTLKQRIEDNLTLFTLGLLATGFAAGFGAYKAVSDASTSRGQSTSSFNTNSWSESARQAEWIPKGECAAYPVTIAIKSPGDGAIVESSRSGSATLYTDLVIQSSRPLPPSSALGLVVNEEGTTNFYMTFPRLTQNEAKNTFRDSDYVFLPFRPTNGARLNMWAVLVDDEKKFGRVYSSLEQIQTSGLEVVASTKTMVHIVQRD